MCQWKIYKPLIHSSVLFYFVMLHLRYAFTYCRSILAQVCLHHLYYCLLFHIVIVYWYSFNIHTYHRTGNVVREDLRKHKEQRHEFSTLVSINLIALQYLMNQLVFRFSHDSFFICINRWRSTATSCMLWRCSASTYNTSSYRCLSWFSKERKQARTRSIRIGG